MITLDQIWQPKTQQRIYRALLQAHSFPGRAIDLSADIDDHPAALAVLATLLDTSTSFCDADGLVGTDDQLRFEATTVPANEADFLLLQADLAPPDGFAPRRGDVYRPHEGATLVLSGRSITHGDSHFELTGPGIASTQSLDLSGFALAWFAEREHWVSAYPTGVDLILCDSSCITAIPRTTTMRRRPEAAVSKGGRR